MQSRNKKPMTRLEREHVERVKSQKCSVCGARPPSSAHHIVQSQHYTTIALCWDCHQGPNGWHGTKALWRIRKLDELGALNITLAAVDREH